MDDELYVFGNIYDIYKMVSMFNFILPRDKMWQKLSGFK
jgi:hypothetical protein